MGWGEIASSAACEMKPDVGLRAGRLATLVSGAAAQQCGERRPQIKNFSYCFEIFFWSMNFKPKMSRSALKNPCFPRKLEYLWNTEIGAGGEHS